MKLGVKKLVTLGYNPDNISKPRLVQKEQECSQSQQNEMKVVLNVKNSLIIPAPPFLQIPYHCKKPQVRMSTVQTPIENVDAPSSVRAEGAGSNEMQGAIDKSQYESHSDSQQNVVFLSLTSLLDSKTVYYTVFGKDEVKDADYSLGSRYPKTQSGKKIKKLIYHRKVHTGVRYSGHPRQGHRC